MNLRKVHCDGQDKVVAIIHDISASEILHSGELIGLGPEGAICDQILGKHRFEGDQIKVTVEKIGLLSNKVRKP